MYLLYRIFRNHDESHICTLCKKPIKSFELADKKRLRILTSNISFVAFDLQWEQENFANTLRKKCKKCGSEMCYTCYNMPPTPKRPSCCPRCDTEYTGKTDSELF